MDKREFLEAVGLTEPMLAVQGDIFTTPADHIAFAVNFPSADGSYRNSGGFAGEVARMYWPELVDYKFERGKPVSRFCTQLGKTLHALPVHSNEEGGWKDAPILITDCFNQLHVPSNEVIASVLIGGGKSGAEFGANPRNIEAMAMSYKTIVVYLLEETMMYHAIQSGLLASPRRAHRALPGRPLGVRVLMDYDPASRTRLLEKHERVEA